MSKTGNPRIVVEGLGLLVPMLKGLVRWIIDLGLLVFIHKIGFDTFLAYAGFRRGQEVDWSQVDIGDCFFHYRWRTKEIIALADKRVHESKREADGRFVYHERWLPAIAVRIKPEVGLSSFDDAITAT